jgi:O-antigen biosynthesis protein
VQVSFVIPLFNCLPLTQAMLASLHATMPEGLAHEIILVDDGSTDGTREWLATLNDPRCRVLLNDRNLGYAAANNRAAATARGRFLALLNNDLVLQPRWLQRMLSAHASLRGGAGLIGNVQLDARTGEVDHAGLVINLTGKPVHVRQTPRWLWRVVRPVRIVPAVTGACVLIERSLWERLGGFDEGYFNGGEDIDLSFRARAISRVNAVALRSVVRHHVSASPGRKARDEQNSFRLAQRWENELLDAADAGRRQWCRNYLEEALLVPESREYQLALAACAYLSRVSPIPPAAAIAGVRAGLAQEFARWKRMFKVEPDVPIGLRSNFPGKPDGDSGLHLNDPK